MVSHVMIKLYQVVIPNKNHQRVFVYVMDLINILLSSNEQILT